MRILADTNILLRIAEPTHSQYDIAQRAVAALMAKGDAVCVVPQVMYEFWVASTRPTEQNGLGFSTAIASQELSRIEAIFSLLDDMEGIAQVWKQLVIANDVKGKVAHDAHLVAAMMKHGVAAILTFNKPDFNRYPGISVMTPEELLSPASP